MKSGFYMNDSVFPGRIGRLRGVLAGEGLDSFLAVRPENRYYLTGFTGTSGSVLITGSETYLFTDFRYDQQAREQSPHCRVVVAPDTLMETMGGMEGELDFSRLGCEGDYLTHLQFNALGERLPGREIRPTAGLVEGLRAIKDEGEIGAIAAAAGLSDQALDHILPFIREGVTEAELALEIEFFMRRKGAEGAAFSLIVASGPRSAMPHGTATGRRLAGGELLTMDFGAVVGGYCSDITRTVAVGRADKKMEEIYRIVLEAQLAGIDAVREGVPASAADRAAREVIRRHGYGGNFGHSTGHGLGLQVHESPRLSSRDNSILRKGMVVTVEPGIYLPGWGGVRIEDSVVVEEKGCRVLTSSPKEKLMVCG